MDINKLHEFIKKNKLPDYRFRQIIKAVYQDSIIDFADITTIPKELRELLARNFSILPFVSEKTETAGDRKSAKALLRLTDGNLVETVIMSVKTGRWTVCVSSQVGCPLGCVFCATGAIDFERNLTAEEISGQVLFWNGYLKKLGQGEKATNIVYMGMGEPFLNWPEVKNSLEILTDKDLFGFGARSISISTAGLPDGIKALAQEFPQVNLAVSLNSADDTKRSELMPINNANNLTALHQAIEYYQKLTNRKIFIEYIMLAGFNDGIEDVKELIRYIRSFPKPHLLHVNLIPYNAAILDYMPSTKEDLIKFKDYLGKSQVAVTIRKSLGADISGACGQLAGKRK